MLPMPSGTKPRVVARVAPLGPKGPGTSGLGFRVQGFRVYVAGSGIEGVGLRDEVEGL